MLDLLASTEEWDKLRMILLSDHRWYRVKPGTFKVLLGVVIFEEINDVNQHMNWVVKVSKDHVVAAKFEADDVLY